MSLADSSFPVTGSLVGRTLPRPKPGNPIPRKLTREKQDAVLRDYMSGASESYIAAKYGVGQNYARVLARRRGLSRARKRKGVAYPDLLDRIKTNFLAAEQVMRELHRDISFLSELEADADAGDE